MGRAWADVWKRGCFAWDYKGKHADLSATSRQLLQYRKALENPPLLVVCDIDRIEAHTNFTKTLYTFAEYWACLANWFVWGFPIG